MLASSQCNSRWQTRQSGRCGVVGRGIRVRNRAGFDPQPQDGGPLDLAQRTYARLLRKSELDLPLVCRNTIECPEATLSPTWQLPGLYVSNRDKPKWTEAEAGLQILHHLQRHACYPPPPSQDAAAEGLPVPGSQEWAQLMAATGREARILPCSLHQPCRVCQKQHITPSELQLAGHSPTGGGADDAAAKQLSSAMWADATHDPVVDLGQFLKSANGSWLVAVPVLQAYAAGKASSSRSSTSSSRGAADAAMKALREAAAQTPVAQCPKVVGTHLLVPLEDLCSSAAVQAAIAAACEQQLAEAQQQGRDATALMEGASTTSGSSSEEEEPPAVSSSSSSSSSSPALQVSPSSLPDTASSDSYTYSIEPPKLCLHVRLRKADYLQLAGDQPAVSSRTQTSSSSSSSSSGASKQRRAVRLDTLRWKVAPGFSRRRQLDSLFALGRSGLHGLLVAGDDHLDTGLQWLLESVTADGLVSLDMEWPTQYMSGQDQKVALIQLASPTRCLLVRMRQHQRQLPEALRRFLRRPDITVLAQSWNSSDSVMMANMGMSGEKEFTRLLDLQPLSEAMGYCKPGLAGMVQALLYPGFMKHKRVTRSKWDAQRLSEAQVRYAILDSITVQHVFRTLLQQHRSNYTLAARPALSGPVFTRTASSRAPVQPPAPAPSEQAQVQQQQQSWNSNSTGEQTAGPTCACPECGLPYGAMVAAPALLVCSYGGCTAIPTRSCTTYAQHCSRSGHWQHTSRWVCSSCRRFVYEHQWEPPQEELAASSLPADGLQLQEAAFI